MFQRCFKEILGAVFREFQGHFKELVWGQKSFKGVLQKGPMVVHEYFKGNE